MMNLKNIDVICAQAPQARFDRKAQCCGHVAKLALTLEPGLRRHDDAAPLAVEPGTEIFLRLASAINRRRVEEVDAKF